LGLLLASFTLLSNQSFAVDYRDSSGYIPSWAPGNGYHTVLVKCTQVSGDGSSDSYWCLEWMAYVLDQGIENFPESTSETSSATSTTIDPNVLVKGDLYFGALTKFLPSDSFYEKSWIVGAPFTSTSKDSEDFTKLGLVDLVTQGIFVPNIYDKDGVLIVTVLLKFENKIKANEFFETKKAEIQNEINSQSTAENINAGKNVYFDNCSGYLKNFDMPKESARLDCVLDKYFVSVISVQTGGYVTDSSLDYVLPDEVSRDISRNIGKNINDTFQSVIDSQTGGITISDEKSCTTLIPGAWWNNNHCIVKFLSIDSGQTLTISKGIGINNSGGTFKNSGTFNVLGSMNNWGYFENFGTINVSGQVSINDNRIINKGTIIINDGASVVVQDSGTLENYGIVKNNDQLINYGIINNHCDGVISGNPVGMKDFGIGKIPIKQIPCEVIIEESFNISKQSKDKLVILQTNQGKIVIEFFYNDAPNHVENFIKLSQSGFYGGTIFHRIIPGFMIQGGDPNTISGDPSTWGQGGPTERVDAEFNTIKHNRGIVSMARSADPDSGGSQFFIIHKNSNFLDEQYTVFGRIATEESFETLDKIISVEIGSSDRPTDPEQVKITKATVVNRSEVSNLLILSEPERTQSTITHTMEKSNNLKSTKIVNTLNDRDEIIEKLSYLFVKDPNDRYLLTDMIVTDDKTKTSFIIINERDRSELGTLILYGDDKISSVITATTFTGLEEMNDADDIHIYIRNDLVPGCCFGLPTHSTMLMDNIDGDNAHAEKTFDNVKIELSWIETNSAFRMGVFTQKITFLEDSISKQESTITSSEQNTANSGGGCLIATATYGSELAPQVQQLRELRDNQLLNTESGTSFINSFNGFYYSFSPIIADYERENPVFKEMVKIAITPMISSLSILNYVDMDSEVEVLGYGISLILLNVGMYFGIPAVVIIGIRKSVNKF